MNIHELKINNLIVKGLEEMGFENFTPIQEQAIPAALSGRDIIGQAQTGTGKTAAFTIPLLENTNFQSKSVQHLILSPTRELANQIAEEIKKIGQFLPVRVATIVGGVDYEKQRRDLAKNPQFVVATPGRANDLIKGKKLNISEINTFVLDEADEMLKQGFLEEVELIIKNLPEQRQNLLFSATIDERVDRVVKKVCQDPVKIEVATGFIASTNIKQYYMVCKEKTKFNLLGKFLETNPDDLVIIFGRTRRRVDELTTSLNKIGFKARGLQGDMSQKAREIVMKSYREKDFNILVATDVVARGIDVKGINSVINFDLPQEVEYYTHRIGRTGRAGTEGRALSFVKDGEMFHLKKIEKETNSVIEEFDMPTVADIRHMKLDKQIAKVKEIVEKGDFDHFLEAAQELMAFEKPNQIIAALLKHEFDKTNPSAADITLTGEVGIIEKKPRRRIKDYQPRSRAGRERKEREERSGAEGSDRPRRERSDSDRPRRERSDRPRGERSDRPRRERSDSDRPRRERSDSDRPRRDSGRSRRGR